MTLLRSGLLATACFTLICATSGGAFGQAAAPPTTRAEILPVMEKMADAQLNVAAYKDRSPVGWVAGAFYVGLSRMSHVSKEPRFRDAQLRIANANNWEFKSEHGPRGYSHADDEAVGQMYIDLALATNDLSKLDTIKKQWDEVIAGFENPTPETRRQWSNDQARDQQTLPWWWCDALFMAPAGMTRLSVVTWDRKYIDAMDKQWWVTYDKLYDKEEHLFFRDNKYPTQRTENGKKVFWSRGDGWVFAGTANVLTYMPKDYPTRPKYEQLFKEMAEKLASIQQPDGLWRGSLVDPAASPWPETSGTAFFTYGMAWGINNQLLPKAKYQAIVNKGWAALNERIRPDGLLGFVQAIGEKPAASTIDNTQAYATGAYLLAGCEMIKMEENK